MIKNVVVHMLWLIAFTSAFAAHAFDFSVQVLDQFGQPVAHVVVEIPEHSANSASNTVMMDQINRRFEPMVISAHVGQLISFPNKDNIRHHVYSFSPAKTFSTELFANEPADPILLDREGIIVLGCNIHDSMVGYVYVTSWQQVTTNSEGIAVFSELESKPERIQLWHPWVNGNEVVDMDTSSLIADTRLQVNLEVQAPEQNFGFRSLRDNQASPR